MANTPTQALFLSFSLIPTTSLVENQTKQPGTNTISVLYLAVHLGTLSLKIEVPIVLYGSSNYGEFPHLKTLSCSQLLCEHLKTYIKQYMCILYMDVMTLRLKFKLLFMHAYTHMLRYKLLARKQ